MINKCDPPPGQDNDSNATRPRAEKTVDDSWSTDWSSLIKFSYLFYSGQVKILVNDLGTLMILDTKTNSLSAYKLLQLLRRLTGWAMMAADDIHWSWVERQHPPTDSRRGLVFSAAPAGKSRRPALPRAARRFSLQTQLLSTSSMDYKYNDDGDDDGDSTETWSLDF